NNRRKISCISREKWFMQEGMKLICRENGYYYIQYYRGKKKSLDTKDKDIATAMFKQEEEDYLKGKLLHLQNYKTITLGQFRKTYVETYRTGLAKHTTRQDERSLQRLAEAIGDSTPLSMISPAKSSKKTKIEEFKTICLARKVRPVSINSYLRHIKKALNIAVEYGIMENYKKITMLKVGKKLPKIMYPAQVNALLSKTKEEDINEWLYYMICIWTGARREEAAGVDWIRISLERERITLIGKGRHERVVRILRPLKEALEPFKKDLGPVFPKQHLDTYTHHFKKRVRAMGIKDIHLHNLRHTAATYMLKSGIDIKTISKILGHASVTTTEIYADVLAEMIAKEMEKYEIK
ncbi:MAG: tyrosine-type recombinase/integrase, partial [Candidatus Omnitrophica bacterium]|nr:tyrosine-type recombinase/integrase [Candidatus Omnitrophota bacterium]